MELRGSLRKWHTFLVYLDNAIVFARNCAEQLKHERGPTKRVPRGKRMSRGFSSRRTRHRSSPLRETRCRPAKTIWRREKAWPCCRKQPRESYARNADVIANVIPCALGKAKPFARGPLYVHRSSSPLLPPPPRKLGCRTVCCSALVTSLRGAQA